MRRFLTAVDTSVMPTAPWTAVAAAAARLEARASGGSGVGVSVDPLAFRDGKLVLPEEDLTSVTGIVVGTRDKMLLEALLSEDCTPKLEWVHALAAGVDQLPFDALRERDGLIVTHHTGISSRPLAEFVAASFLHFSKHVPSVMRAQAQGRWERPPGGLAPVSLNGKTLAVIGTGSIGREVGRMFRYGFGMRVVGMRKRECSVGQLRTEDVDLFSEVVSFDVEGREGLRRILKESDCVVLSMPSTEGTRHLIGREELQCLRPGALICNVGRGNAIEEAALVDALSVSMLEEADVAGPAASEFAPGICASLDVFATEPLPSNSALWGISPNRLLLSPHSADQTDQYWDSAAAAFEANALAYLEGDIRSMGPFVDLELGY